MALTIPFIVNGNANEKKKKKKKVKAFFQIMKFKIYTLQRNKYSNKILPIQNRTKLLSIFPFMLK